MDLAGRDAQRRQIQHPRADAPGGGSGQKAAVCLVGGRVAAHAVGAGAGGVLCDVGQGHGAVQIPPTNVVPYTVASQPAGHTLTALLQMGAHGVDIRPQLDAHALGVHLQDAERDLVSRQQGEVFGGLILLHVYPPLPGRCRHRPHCSCWGRPSGCPIRT